MSKQTRDRVVNEGWAIQVYSSDRHLLCSIYPSHGWTFAIGMVLGLLIAIAGMRHPTGRSTTAPATRNSPPQSAPAQNLPTPFWID